MSRRNLDREHLIAAVVRAWDAVPSERKPDLMIAQPGLYSACAWLAAYERVRTDR